MNYIDELGSQIGGHCGGAPASLLRIYAVLALTKGTSTTREDVHDAWSAWCAGEVPDHRSLIPFDQLSPEVQALDQPYVDAIRMVAAMLPVRISTTMLAAHIPDSRLREERGDD